jgi:hypothetical protein
MFSINNFLEEEIFMKGSQIRSNEKVAMTSLINLNNCLKAKYRNQVIGIR